MIKIVTSRNLRIVHFFQEQTATPALLSLLRDVCWIFSFCVCKRPISGSVGSVKKEDRPTLKSRDLEARSLASPTCLRSQFSQKLLMRHQRQLEYNECHIHCELEQPENHLENAMRFGEHSCKVETCSRFEKPRTGHVFRG